MMDHGGVRASDLHSGPQPPNPEDAFLGTMEQSMGFMQLFSATGQRTGRNCSSSFGELQLSDDIRGRGVGLSPKCQRMGVFSVSARLKSPSINSYRSSYLTSGEVLLQVVGGLTRGVEVISQLRTCRRMMEASENGYLFLISRPNEIIVNVLSAGIFWSSVR